MPSRSLRKDVVPPKAIALWFCANACRPSDYCHVTAYNGKYVKSVAACTNPGGTGGTATHQHTGTTVPAHPAICPTAAPHSHPGGTSPSQSGTSIPGQAFSPPTCPYQPISPVNAAGYAAHTHANPLGANPATICPATVPAHSSHQHAASCNSPPNVTTSFIQKANSISMRKRTLAPKIKAIWACTLASIPSGYAKYTTYLGKILQAVANACTNPGTTGGSTCHTHGSANAHTHPVSIAAHTHPQSNNPASTGSFNLSFSSPTAINAAGHSHTSTIAPSTGSGTSTCAGGHTIAASCIQPTFYTVVPIDSTSISMRTHGVPKKTILIWKCPTACIPTCFALANGSSCTPNLLCKYLKTVATACTNPGTTGGANSHSHTCPSTHSHTVCIPHSHPQDYTGNAPQSGGNCGNPSVGPVMYAHTSHPGVIQSGTASAPTTIAANASHVHASVASEPCNVQVAYIQRL